MSAVIAAIGQQDWEAYQLAWVSYLREHGEFEDAEQLERRVRVGLGICPGCGAGGAWDRRDPEPSCLGVSECEPYAILDALAGPQPA